MLREKKSCLCSECACVKDEIYKIYKSDFIYIKGILNASKVCIFTLTTSVKIKCHNSTVIQLNRYIYLEMKQHAYSDLYLLKYIKE